MGDGYNVPHTKTEKVIGYDLGYPEDYLKDIDYDLPKDGKPAPYIYWHDVHDVCDHEKQDPDSFLILDIKAIGSIDMCSICEFMKLFAAFLIGRCSVLFWEYFQVKGRDKQEEEPS